VTRSPQGIRNPTRRSGRYGSPVDGVVRLDNAARARTLHARKPTTRNWPALRARSYRERPVANPDGRLANFHPQVVAPTGGENEGGRGGRIRTHDPGVGNRSFGKAKLRPY